LSAVVGNKLKWPIQFMAYFIKLQPEFVEKLCMSNAKKLTDKLECPPEDIDFFKLKLHAP